MNLDSLHIVRNNKPIIQLEPNGEFIKEWPSTAEVFRALKINKGYIINCLKGRRGEAGGYKWRYKK